jgi:fructose 1,6-bisphosphatase
MKITLSIIKAGIGSLGGRIKPSTPLFKKVEEYVREAGKGTVLDQFVSHNGPLIPVKMNSGVSFFDGPPVVRALAFCVHKDVLTEPADAFDTRIGTISGQRCPVKQRN